MLFRSFRKKEEELESIILALCRRLMIHEGIAQKRVHGALSRPNAVAESRGSCARRHLMASHSSATASRASIAGRAAPIMLVLALIEPASCWEFPAAEFECELAVPFAIARKGWCKGIPANGAACAFWPGTSAHAVASK